MDIPHPITVKLNPDWFCRWEDTTLCMMVGSALE